MTHVCRCCETRFEYPNEIKKYGRYYICNNCIKEQTKCEVCNKKRAEKTKTDFGMACYDCRMNLANLHGFSWTCNQCLTNVYKNGSRVTVAEQMAHGCDTARDDGRYHDICIACFDKSQKKHVPPLPLGDCLFCGCECLETEIDGGPAVFACPTCKKEHKPFYCEQGCGRLADTHNYTWDTRDPGNQKRMCHACYEDIYRYCEYCGEHRLADGFVEQKNGNYAACAQCVENLENCAACGVLGKLYKAGEHDKMLCRRCASKYKTCQMCKKMMLDVIPTTRAIVACPNCRHQHGLGVQRRHDYKPEVFTHRGTGMLYLGIENEMGLNPDYPKDTYLEHIARTYKADMAYTQHDGTINFGTEVVFHPMTLKYAHKVDFAPLFAGHMLPHVSCGMHVHMSRAAFNKLHLYRFMRFFALNPKMIELVAGRCGKSYRDIKNTNRVGWEFTSPELLFEKACGKKVHEHKYTDINLLHDKTVEIRVFKAADSVQELYKNLEFCHALWGFTRASGTETRTCLDFYKYVEQNASLYINLFEFLAPSCNEIALFTSVPAGKHMRYPKPQKRNPPYDFVYQRMATMQDFIATETLTQRGF